MRRLTHTQVYFSLLIPSLNFSDPMSRNMPQLQINQGPQDALLYDNTRSYFTNIGYTRTSNFQAELRDVPPQNAATFGSTVQFVIPKAADLMGCCDLMLDLKATTGTDNLGTIGNDKKVFLSWVEALGFAMIDKVTFSVGSHDIETVTGDQMYITNELMRSDEQRFGKSTILKTGRPFVRVDCGDSSSTTWTPVYDTNISYNNSSRLICVASKGGSTAAVSNTNYLGKKLIIPLNLFFTKHPSAYFPLAAIAGCNDVRISIKFRNLKEVLCGRGEEAVAGGAISAGGEAAAAIPQIVMDNVRLRTHYVHVTGPEASLLMNKEHVRLLKLWQHHSVTSKIESKFTISNLPGGDKANLPGQSVQTLFDFELPFLHPVQEIIIVIRKASEMSDSTDFTADSTSAYDMKGVTKNYFAFHGGNKDPNIDSIRSTTKQGGTDATLEAYLNVAGFKLTLNGQERHPSLAGDGISRDYLMNRLMPMLHSNTSSIFGDIEDGHASTSVAATTSGSETTTTHVSDWGHDNFKALSEKMDRKEIYVYPFALNPEGANPSGAVNFSKVSHAKLQITGQAYSTGTPTDAIEYRCDVYGVHYNWLQIKDGRAITSFA